jgi:hypothetical protein
VSRDVPILVAVEDIHSSANAAGQMNGKVRSDIYHYGETDLPGRPAETGDDVKAFEVVVLQRF